MTIEEKRERNRDKMRLWRERNKDRVPTPEQRTAHNERNRRYREKHPDTIRRIATESNSRRRTEKATWAKQRYETRTEEQRQAENLRSKLRQRQWTKNNREITRIRSRQYYWTNRLEISEKSKSREARAKAAQRLRIRRRNDPAFRMLSNLRARLWHAVSGRGYKRAARTLDFLGCSITELKSHLEKKFRRGMSWDNYGLWHVDHVKPCASFDFNDPAQQRACFHYLNLQPLWAQENHMKSRKVVV